jgi:hypothetical protein
MFEHGATINVKDCRDRNPMEVLCTEESVWKQKNADGTSSFDDRLAVLKVLIKHGPFTDSYRDDIAQWKDTSLKIALVKELPWRSIPQIAGVAISWTIYTGIPFVVKGAIALRQANAETEKQLKARRDSIERMRRLSHQFQRMFVQSRLCIKTSLTTTTAAENHTSRSMPPEYSYACKCNTTPSFSPSATILLHCILYASFASCLHAMCNCWRFGS